MKQCAGNAFNCFSRRFSLCTIRVRNSPKTTKSAFRFLPCVGAFALAPHPLLLQFEFYPLSCSFICFCKDRYCYAICITKEQKKSIFYCCYSAVIRIGAYCLLFGCYSVVIACSFLSETVGKTGKIPPLLLFFVVCVKSIGDCD